jgi:hypothetical protein
VIGALQRAGIIELIPVRHEEMAAFLAVAHASSLANWACGSRSLLIAGAADGRFGLAADRKHRRMSQPRAEDKASAATATTGEGTIRVRSVRT